MRCIHPILLIFLFSISVNAQSTKEEYFEFGKKLLEENYQSSAIECFDKAIQLDSNFAEAFYYRGLVFLVTYKSDFKLRAIKYDFERAISLKKENNFWKAYETLADLRFPRDSISLDYYDIAIRINPNNPNLYLKKAQIFYLWNKDADAMKELDCAIACDNSYYRSYYVRGQFYFIKLKDYRKAYKDFKKAEKLNPDNLSLNFYISKILVEEHLGKSTKNSYKKAVESGLTEAYLENIRKYNVRVFEVGL